MSTARTWAIVTGASSGIGRALALEFAGGGYNVLLTGRNEPALAEVASECAAKFRVETEVVAADLAQLDSIDGLVRAAAVRDRVYEVLVNNAGFGVHGEFAQTPIDQEIDMLHVQLAAALKLTKAVLPGMIARRGGRILNVASVYSFAPVPFQAVYSACKAFLLAFSSSLQNELKGTGVTVTLFCPGVTRTAFRARAGIGEKRKESGMTAEAAARIAFVETLRGKPVVIPGLVNRAFVLASKLMPREPFGNLVRYINRKRLHQN